MNVKQKDRLPQRQLPVTWEREKIGVKKKKRRKAPFKDEKPKISDSQLYFILFFKFQNTEGSVSLRPRFGGDKEEVLAVQLTTSWVCSLSSGDTGLVFCLIAED